MSKIDSLILLVNSMSKVEKRFLQMHMKMHSGRKDYQVLYGLLQSPESDPDTLRKRFGQQCPGAGFETGCHYLYKLLVKNLIALESEKDLENQLLRQFMESKVLFQRGLSADCFKQIEIGKNLSLEYEKFYFFNLFARLELQLLNQLEFRGVSEETLLKKQGKLESVARRQRSIDNHSALYDLIRYRQINQGPVRSPSEKERLSDLAFNELHASSGQAKDSFEDRKIHLLFQSAYFMMTANPKAGLKVFYELNALFEANKHLWASPPVYYLYHLHGILNNLRSSRQYDEMPYFIERAGEIIKTDPGAANRVKHLTFLYESYMLTDRGKYPEALEHLKRGLSPPGNLPSDLPPSSYAEQVLQIACVRYKNRQLREALKELLPILHLGKSVQQLSVYHSIRLLMVMIRFDLKEFEYLMFEIRSFERELLRSDRSHGMERLILVLIRKLMSPLSREKRNLLIQRGLGDLTEMMKNPNENLRISSLDLTGWLTAQRKTGGQAFL